MTIANTRIPYASTLAQAHSSSEPVPPTPGAAPAQYGIATEAGHLGGPAYPNPQPFVRGEK